MWDQAGPFATIPDDMEPYGTIWSDSTKIDHMGPILTKQDPLGPYTGPWETIFSTIEWFNS